MMEFIVKTTTELSKEEIGQINDLFKDVFKKERSEKEFLNQSINNPLGYSYHSLMIEDGHIVGLNSFVPAYFLSGDEKLLFANSTDSMISKPFRDFFNFNDIVTNGFKRMKHDGVKFVYGYPNDNSYPVLIKAKLYRDIGKMHTYCLPLHIGGIKSALKFLNPVSELLCQIYVRVCGLVASTNPETYHYQKETDTYNTSRYKRGDGEYNIVSLEDFTFYYKIKDHEGVRTAFLIDISKKSPKAFNKAIRYITKHHRRDFDLLLYPGSLAFSNTGMIRIPRRFEPKNFNFTGRALDKKLFDDSIWDIRNWDTNLSNYDLI